MSHLNDPATLRRPMIDGDVVRAAFPYERANWEAEGSTPKTVQRREAWALNLLGAHASLSELVPAVGLLTGADVDRIIGSPPQHEALNVSDWRAVVDEALTQQFSSAASRVGEYAFADVLVPFTELLRKELVRPSGHPPGSTHMRWTPQAHSDLITALGRELSDWSAKVLYTEFTAARPLRSTVNDVMERTSGIPATRTAYQQFTEWMLQDGWRQTLHKYPVLARVLGQTTLNHISAIRALRSRLDLDAAVLRDTFSKGFDLGAVAHISCTGDPHQGGMRVSILEFSSGGRVVYKPRSVGMERLFNDLLAWLNAQGSPERMKTLHVVDRGDYGWVEHVSNEECADPPAIERFYRRSGALLCLVQHLDATDCHYENIVAAGEFPVLVDAETLFHHRFPETDSKGADAHGRAQRWIENTALRTGYLPHWNLSRDRKSAYDASGLSSGGDRGTGDRVLHWIDPNTDRMAFEMRSAPPPRAHNVPWLAGMPPVRPSEFANHVRDGYAEMYRCLVRVRNELLADYGPLTGFREQHCRIVLRPTVIYGTMLSALSGSPERMRDGFDAGIGFEQLGRGWLREPADPAAAVAFAAERAALYRLDVPVFTARVSGCDLDCEGGTSVRDYFPQPSFDVVTERVQRLSAEGLIEQLKVLDTALHVQTRASTVSALAREVDPDFLSLARILAESLDDSAIRGESRDVEHSRTWVAPQYVADTERLQLKPLSSCLYDGIAGIAVFYAALFAVTREAQYARAAVECWSALRAEWRASPRPDAPFAYLGCGAGSGTGSIMYAGVLLATLLHEERFLGDALELAHAAVPSDDAPDVISGTSGLVLGLLAVHSASGNDAVLGAAAECGDSLLRSRMNSSATGLRIWCTSPGGVLLTGFSHGAAGIAYALAKLASATGDERYLSAARDAVLYESSVFDPEVRNWPDLRATARHRRGASFEEAWCHGGPGIALSRIAPGLAEECTDDVDAGLRIATQAVLDSRRTDALCCGRFGLVDVFLTVGRARSYSDMVERARSSAARIVEEAHMRGRFVLSRLLPSNVLLPGLFSGIAGIGYELLRLDRPDLLPSVLIWEPPAL